MKKRIVKTLLGLVIATSLLAGCGNKGGSDLDNYEYIGEFSDFVEIDNANTSVGNMTIAGEYVFYSMYEYDEETWESEETYFKRNLKTGEETTVAFPVDNENEYVNYFGVCSSNGNIVYLSSKWEENGSVSKSYYTLGVIDNAGNVILSKDVTQDIFKDSTEEYNYISFFSLDNAGNVYVSANDNIFAVFDDQGELIAKEDAGYVSGIYGSDGGAYLSVYDNTDDNWEPQLKWYDAEKKNLGDSLGKLPNDIGRITIGEDGNLYLSGGSGLYMFDIKTGETEKILNWMDTDIDGNYITAMKVNEDGSIFIIVRDWSSDVCTVQQATLTKQKITPENKREIINMSVYYLDYDMKGIISAFNKSNKEYRIRVTEYSEYDYDEALEKMQADISGANCPDIIDISQIDSRSIAAQGYLLDLTSYFERDFNRGDYLENVLQAGTLGDKLYVICPKVTVASIAGKGSVLNGKTDWTTSELRDFIVNRKPGTEVFMYATKKEVLNTMLRADIDEFVDWKTGECSFNSDEFISILEMCNEFPEEIDWDNIEDDDSYPKKIQTGQLALFDISYSQVADYQQYYLMSGKDLVDVGLPNGGKCSPIICNYSSLYAISSKSKNADGAWAFISTLLSEENQEKVDYGFPVSKVALQKQYENAMEKEYETVNGKKQEVAKMTYGWDDMDFEIFAATQEEVDIVNSIVESASGSVFTDSKLVDMIFEEAQPYFKGQKTAKEVADIIQSRITLYVGELM